MEDDFAIPLHGCRLMFAGSTSRLGNGLSFMEKQDAICGVYCFTHIESGRKYIGSSIDVNKRRAGHIKKASKYGGSYFHRNLSKLGVESFKFEIIEECKPEERFARERFYIDKFQSATIDGFNTVQDPENGFNYVFSDLIRKRLSLASKGKSKTEEHRKHISEGLKGMRTGAKHSLETRAKMSKSHKCRIRTEEERLRMSALMTAINKTPKKRLAVSIANHNRGPHSQSTRDKISKALTGLKQSEETKAKKSVSGKIAYSSPEVRARMSIRLKGIKKSDETKLKMVLAARNRQPMSAETKSKISETKKLNYLKKKIILCA